VTDLTPLSSAVIPAKAGIHRADTVTLAIWTPAFAGVTALVGGVERSASCSSS
jgi:hypothetical protein